MSKDIFVILTAAGVVVNVHPTNQCNVENLDKQYIVQQSANHTPNDLAAASPLIGRVELENDTGIAHFVVGQKNQKT